MLKNTHFALVLLVLVPVKVFGMHRFAANVDRRAFANFAKPFQTAQSNHQVSDKLSNITDGIFNNGKNPHGQPRVSVLEYEAPQPKLSPLPTSLIAVQEPMVVNQPLVDRLIIHHPIVDIKMTLDVLTTEFIMEEMPKLMVNPSANNEIISPASDIGWSEFIMEEMPKLMVNPSANNEIVSPASDIGWSELFPLIEAQAQENYFGKIRINGIKYSNTDSSVVVENMDKEFSNAQLLKAEVINAIKDHPYITAGIAAGIFAPLATAIAYKTNKSVKNKIDKKIKQVRATTANLYKSSQEELTYGDVMKAAGLSSSILGAAYLFNKSALGATQGYAATVGLLGVVGYLGYVKNKTLRHPENSVENEDVVVQ
jgi:hypothetical protein